ncbi:putative secreted protein (Por secretion system target) [Chryseobacterium daecheongense]|uniref:Secreted protein (Por secretion system target) n=2 Tax=Chryseobacterium daecheongense TaxID=192389 RepID=A0ABY2FUX6_9FLAO|nr:putative secreted protein (Por secretion system target) [Chryseobacterium daecheongense]
MRNKIINMKKFLLLGFVSLGIGAFAQTYCTPQYTYGCDDGDQIDSFEIPSASFSHLNTGCSTNAYGDYTTQTISMNAGLNYPFSVTHNYGSQNIRIWIDFNNDGNFDDSAPELVASASSSNINGSDITNGAIILPATATTGVHRMRVGDRYSSQPIPCNADGYGEVHDYMVNIGAAPSCLAPSNVTVNGVTSNSATISWVASPSTVGVGYEYYVSTSNTAPTTTTNATGTAGPSAVSVTLPSNLAAATNYYVWVRAACSATDKSQWSIGATFTTACATIVPTYTNDFATFPPTCWEQLSGGSPTGTPPTGTYGYWYEDGFLGSGSTGSAVINLYTTDTEGWLKTVPFNLSAGGYRVKFDYGITEYNGTASSAMGSDDVIQFVVSSDGGNTWTVLQTWTAANAPSNTSTQFSLNLTSYTGANTIFAFYGSDGTVNDTEDYEFFIDNFTVEPAPLATSEVSGTKNNIKAYPNPFTDVLNISEIRNVKSVSVTDAVGRLIKTIDNPGSALHLGDLKQGMYFITLNLKDGSQQTIKAIKK